MAKIIKYKYVANEINHGTVENPDVEQILFDKTLGWSETAEEIADNMVSTQSRMMVCWSRNLPLKVLCGMNWMPHIRRELIAYDE